MATVTVRPIGPISSAEFNMPGPERIAEVEQKQEQVAEFLKSQEYDALLLQNPGNFAWFTSGADNSCKGSSKTSAALFITPDARVVVCSNTDSSQIFEHEIPGLGFQLKVRPWHEPRHLLLEDLCNGRRVASDTGFNGTTDVSLHLAGMRNPLTTVECERLRLLGKQVAHAVEATARSLTSGRTEAEIAGEVAHRLIKRSIVPERIQVCADERADLFRHWSYSETPVENSCVISVTGRKDGLCCGVSRTVAFGTMPEKLKECFYRATLMQATGITHSLPDWEVFETWNRLQRIYEKFDAPDEWHYAEQADVIGYEPCEFPVVPRSEFRLTANMAVFWHPSVGVALTGDTILINEKSFEIITPMESWPKVTINVKGQAISLPDILVRPEGSTAAE